MLETFNAMALYALSEALKRYDSTLPDHLVQKIHQVGQDLEENLESSNECDSLYDLVDELENNPEYNTLFELYEQEYSLLQEPDQKKERNKGIPPQEETQLPPDPPYGKNATANCQFLTGYQSMPGKNKPQTSDK
ncbi:MAG: hypothetical protein ACRCU2_23000 [Planktothrix sp.]